MDSSNPVIEALLNCPICLERFQRPKLLHCGHSYCLGCLEQMRGRDALSVTCPLCKAATFASGGLSSLTDDFRLNQIQDGLETVAATKGAVEFGRRCDVCSRTEPEVTCLQCHKAMCAGCLSKHQRRAGTAMHTLLRTSDEVSCKKHKDLCSHACPTCFSLVCTSCLFDQCCEHETQEIGEAARKYVDWNIVRASQLHPSFKQNDLLFQAEDPGTGCIRSSLLTLLPFVVANSRVFAASSSRAESSQGASGLSVSLTPKKPEPAPSKPPVVHVTSGLAVVTPVNPGHPVHPPPVALALPVPPVHPPRVALPLPVPEPRPQSVSVNPNAYINMQDELRNKPLFRFPRVVLDDRPGCEAVVANIGNVILRYNIEQPAGENMPLIEIFLNGLTTGFHQQQCILTENSMLFHQRGWKRYLPEVKALTKDYHIYRRWIFVENYSDVTHKTALDPLRKIPFQFDKVVHDRRFDNEVIVADCGEDIIRCDFNCKTDISHDRVTIPPRQSCHYALQANLLDDHPDFFSDDLSVWEPRIPQLRAMIKKYKEFLSTLGPAQASPSRHPLRGPLKFDRIVHDRRRGNSALVAEYRDLIVRNDFTDQEDDVDFYHPCEHDFNAEQDLLNKFCDILNTNWQDQFLAEVRAMVKELRQHISECNHPCACGNY